MQTCGKDWKISLERIRSSDRKIAEEVQSRLVRTHGQDVFLLDGPRG